jgi:hypothetical protein
MASVVDICNYALNHIGKGTISALDSSTEASRRCSLRFEPVRDKVLADYPWKFARRQVALALTANTVVGWDYVYTYPANCVKVRKVFTEETLGEVEPQPFDIFNVAGVQCVASNLESAYAEFTYKVTDPTLFDPMFVEALSYALASDLAFQLTGSDGVRDKMLRIYFSYLSQAQASSAQERYEEPKYAKSYTTGRWS